MVVITAEAKSAVSLDRFSQCLVFLARNSKKLGLAGDGVNILKSRLIIATFCKFPNKDGVSVILIVPEKGGNRLFTNHPGKDGLAPTTAFERDASKNVEFGACVVSPDKNASIDAARELSTYLSGTNLATYWREDGTVSVKDEFNKKSITLFACAVKPA